MFKSDFCIAVFSWCCWWFWYTTIVVSCDPPVREGVPSSWSKLLIAAYTRFPGTIEGCKGTFLFPDIWIVLNHSEHFCLSISSYKCQVY